MFWLDYISLYFTDSCNEETQVASCVVPSVTSNDPLGSDLNNNITESISLSDFFSFLLRNFYCVIQVRPVKIFQYFHALFHM